MGEDLLSCISFLRNHLFGSCKKHVVSQRHSLDEYGDSNLITDSINAPVSSRNDTYHNLTEIMSDLKISLCELHRWSLCLCMYRWLNDE